MTDESIPLGEGAFAFVNTIPIDERLSWYPPAVRGFTSVNVYLVTSGGSALLIDSGVTLHRDSLLSQIEQHIDPTTALSIALTRIGEFQAISNASAVQQAFGVEQIFGSVPEPHHWVEFRPFGERNEPPRRPRPDKPSTGVLIRHGHDIHVDPEGHRRLRAELPTLRLLPFLWFYDYSTKVLFTGDSFTHLWSREEAGPWVVDGANDQIGGTTPDEVRDHMLIRCWWTARAPDLTTIRRGLSDVFERLDIETIAPGYGAIIRGRELVEHHYSAMQDALARVEGNGHQL